MNTYTSKSLNFFQLNTLTCIYIHLDITTIKYLNLMSQQTDLSEYASYLPQDSFDPIQYANTLTLQSTSQDDNILDLKTPIKKLKFDLKDMNKKLQKNSNENYQLLLNEFNQVERWNELTIEEMRPSLNQVNLSYNRLQVEIIKPFQDASNYHTALKKIHQTSNLLRSSTYFIYLISKIEEIDKSDSELIKRPYKNMVSLSKLLSTLKSHLTDSSFLKSLKLVRDYEFHQQLLTNKLIDLTSNQFKNLSYLNDGEDDLSILNLIYSCSLISPESLYNLIQNLLSLKINYSINLIIKNLNNVKNLDKVFKELSKIGKFVSILETVMKNNKWFGSTTISLSQDYMETGTTSETSDQQITKTITIYDQISKMLHLNSSLITLFWKDIAVGLEPKFKEIINKGGPISKNLKSINNELKSMVKESVINSFDDDAKLIKTDDCIEIRMMLNSIASIDSKK